METVEYLGTILKIIMECSWVKKYFTLLSILIIYLYNDIPNCKLYNIIAQNTYILIVIIINVTHI